MASVWDAKGSHQRMEHARHGFLWLASVFHAMICKTALPFATGACGLRDNATQNLASNDVQKFPEKEAETNILVQVAH